MLMQPVAGLFIDWVGTRARFHRVGHLVVYREHAAWPGDRVADRWPRAGPCWAWARPATFPAPPRPFTNGSRRAERTIATGIYNSGASIGSSSPRRLWPGSFYWGWRMAFFVTGAIGFLWVILWAIFYRPLARHPWICRQGAAAHRGGPAGTGGAGRGGPSGRGRDRTRAVGGPWLAGGGPLWFSGTSGASPWPGSSPNPPGG